MNRVSLHLYNSLATQMNLTRFEYRLLRFFDDACIPLFSFNINKQVDNLWRTSLPRQFASLDLVRQSVFAFACLNLWRYANVGSVLELDRLISFDHDEKLDSSFSHVFNSLAVFEDSSDSIFTKTASYFSRTVEQTNSHIALEEKKGPSNPDIFFFSSTLIFAFLGLHPHSIMPVVDFDGDPAVDILGFAICVKNVLDEVNGQYMTLMGRIREGWSLLMLAKPAFPSRIVAQLRVDLHDYFFGHSGFAEINMRTSEENELFENVLTVMENSLSIAILKGYPIPFFRMLYATPPALTSLVRAKHPFGLRIIFVYCCMCIFCGFHFQKEANVWIDFAHFHHNHFGPHYALDRALYSYVTEKDLVDFANFSESVIGFDSTVVHMAHQLSDSEMEI